MAYKNIQNYFSFADIAIEKNADNNRSLFLFKCFLLQKWFQIKSDPELESQVAESLSLRQKYAENRLDTG